MLATDGARRAGVPCRWCIGGSVLGDGVGGFKCVQCGRAPEGARAPEKGELLRGGRCGEVGHHKGLVEGRVV
jgi:hypothetical protein